MVNHDKERDLVALISKDRDMATEEIYGVYAGYIYAICSRYLSCGDDVKDVAQESLVKVFTSMRSFRYSGPGSLTSWIVRITVNCALNYLRDNKRLHFAFSSDGFPDIIDEPPETECLSPDELSMLIRDLPDGYRTVFNLFAIEGKKHKEIAKLLGIKENSSASQYLRAKALLAQRIKEYLKMKRD